MLDRQREVSNNGLPSHSPAHPYGSLKLSKVGPKCPGPASLDVGYPGGPWPGHRWPLHPRWSCDHGNGGHVYNAVTTRIEHSILSSSYWPDSDRKAAVSPPETSKVSPLLRLGRSLLEHTCYRASFAYG